MTSVARRVARALIALVVTAASLFSGAAVAHASARSEFEKIAALDVGTGDRLIVDQPAHRLIALRGDGGVPLALTFFDGTRFRKTRTVEFPGLFNQGYSTGRPSVYAIDPARRLLHVVAYHSVAEQLNTANAQLVTINLDNLTVAQHPLTAVFPPGVRPLGLKLEPDGRLLALGQLTVSALIDAPRAFGALVAELDPAGTVAGGGPLVTWGPNPVRGCQALISSQNQAAVTRFDDTLFLGCATSTAVFVPLPGVPSVLAIPMAAPDDVQSLFLPGSYSQGDMYVDDNAGRLLLVGSAPSRPAQAVWVFDLAHRLFLGQVAAGDLNVLASGVNPSNGRLYVAISSTGGEAAVLVGSDRGLGIAQAVSFPVHSTSGVITPTPFDGAVVVPAQTAAGATFYAVYRDRLPESAIAPGSETDYSIVDRSLTETPQFAADVQAFGVRVHEMGGVNGAAQNAFPNGNLNYWAQIGNNTELRDGDRDLAFAQIRGAHLSESDAAAAASSSLADENTDHDYARLIGGPLSQPEASCRDFGSGASSDPADGAATSCDQRAGKVMADAISERAKTPVVEVGSSSSSATLTRTATGVVAMAAAEARNVTIAGSVKIGYIASHAEAKADGTAHKATAIYTRTFRNVEAPGFSCTVQCNVHEVLTALTSTLGTQVRVELPGADVSKTSRGGHAHALRDPWEHQQDVVINNQAVTALEVPALRLSYIADNAAASRVLVELAAAKADTTAYPIGFVPGPPSPPDVPLPRLPVVGGVKIVAPPVAPKVLAAIPHLVSRMTKLPGHGWAFVAPHGAGAMARAISLWGMLLFAPVLAFRRRQLRVVARYRA